MPTTTEIRTRLSVLLLILPLFTNLSGKENQEEDLAKWVDPFIGTAGTGHTFPGATYPLGLVQLSPDTGNGNWDYCAGYQYADVTVDGFSHTHASGGGTGDFGDILILPFSSEGVLAAGKATQDKKVEKASPGYYSTLLTEDQIQVDLSVTERTGIHKFQFLGQGHQQLLISIDRILYSWGAVERSKTYDASFQIRNNSRVDGGYYSNGKARREVYFAISFDRNYISHRFLDQDRKQLVLDFGSPNPEPLVVRIGISTVSPESAWKNLEAENLGKTFDRIHREARSAWNQYLSKIHIKADETHKTLFYTSLYHFYIQPNNIADVEGRYRGADEGIYSAKSGQQYTMLALWDVFRAAYPLHTILSPGKHLQFMEAILDHYDQAGFLPVWGIWGKSSPAMIGNHGATVLQDAIQKRLPGIDEERAYQAVKDTLTQNHWRKYDWSKYDPYGYFPSDLVNAEAVSRTLEACLNDWCAAQLAKRLGKLADYRFFLKRSQFYKNLYDSKTGFFRGKMSDGSWREPFDPLEVFHAGSSKGDYTEANAWQYLWSVQHDVEDLTRLLGGKAALGRRLDELLELPPVIYGKGSTKDVSGMIGQYAHGNEPSQHVPYLYNYSGRPYRTQELVLEVLKTKYQTQADGLSGNDDFGQMSAWYLLSSLGFYPAHPASGIFDIGIPLHEYARVRLPGTSKTLEIRREPFEEALCYVKQVTLDGQPLDGWQITYDQIMKGGELTFEMSEIPAPVSLFNGRDLSDWNGNPSIWSVEDGAITGRTVAPHLLEENQFLIWKGGEVRDFILTMKVRQSGNNSGIQYRSRLMPDRGPWVMGGYQCDVHPEVRNNGMVYDQYGRAILAMNGQKVVVDNDSSTWLMEEGEPVSFPVEEWQDYKIVAQGNYIRHEINGRVTAELYDLDTRGRSPEGWIGLQIHYGPAMEVQFKDLELQVLPSQMEPLAPPLQSVPEKSIRVEQNQ